MGTVICRTGYCPHCHKEKRPFKGNLFLAYGSYRGGYYVRAATRNGIAGYTPRLFILKKVGNDNMCEIETICCVYGCGVEYYLSKETNTMVYGAKKDKWETIHMSIPDWNSLIVYRRDPQFTL